MSRITDEYAKFKRLHSDFLNGVTGAHAELQSLLRRDREGATKLMLFWAASCLNFGSSCRTKHRKKFDMVLTEGWSSAEAFKQYTDRLEKMGIKLSGGYEGNDPELIYIESDAGRVIKAGKCNFVFLPMFKTWFEEAIDFANAIYPSGIMAAAMQSIRTKALNTGGEMSSKPWDDLLSKSRDSELIRPSRASESFRVKSKPEELAQAYGMGPEGLKKFAETQIKHDDVLDAMFSLKKANIIGNIKMSKTNDFVNSIKGIFGATVRMQRGRATVHAVKRIIFKAFPIQWGILARLTGKAKKVEDHPLTDVAVALLAHGAASALLTDPKKRDKYLCYTEEMVAASVANAGLKMVPVEDILDKVLNGAMDSEAISKLKAVLQDQ